MAKIFEIFPDSFPETLDRETRDHISECAVVATSGLFTDDLLKLKQSLGARNLALGDYVGNGSIGIVFRLKAKNGRPIESAVIRIDPSDAVGNAESVSLIPSMMSVGGGENAYVATVVPLAKKIREGKGGPGNGDLERTFSVLKAEGRLDDLYDIKPDQLMHLPLPGGGLVSFRDGTPLPVLIDGGGFNPEMKGTGSVREYAGRQGMDIGTIAPVSQEDLAHLKRQMNMIRDKVRSEMRAAGIRMDPLHAAQEAGYEKGGR